MPFPAHRASRMTARRLMRAGLLAGCALLLAACAGRATRTSPPAALPTLSVAEQAVADARQAERERALQQNSQWSLVGRIAVASGRNGGSGRLEWAQHGGRFEVSVSAPVTRQSWTLGGDDGGARLDGLEGGRRDGPDAAQLLREATGWDVPVPALAYWIRGARASGFGPARLDYGADGRPVRIEQAGWTIDYRWPEPGDGVAAGAGSAVPLPSRIDARRGEARVKLVIDAWGIDG